MEACPRSAAVRGAWRRNDNQSHDEEGHTQCKFVHGSGIGALALLLAVAGFALAALAVSAQSAPTCRGEEATIVLKQGQGVVQGSAGRDVAVGSDGYDHFVGLGGDDLVCLGAGDDRLVGGRGNDTIRGNDGADLCEGGRGTDSLGVGCETVTGVP